MSPLSLGCKRKMSMRFARRWQVIRQSESRWGAFRFLGSLTLMWLKSMFWAMTFTR